MNRLELVEFRKKYKLTQSELAKVTGRSIRAVQSWEQGKRNVPQSAIMLIEKYAQENGVSQQGNNKTEEENIITSDKEIEYLKKINSFLEKENKYIRENFGKEIKGLKEMVETLTKDNSKLKEVGTKINKIIEELSIKYQIDDEIDKVQNDSNGD